MMAGMLLDVRHAIRLYRKTPWQSGLAIFMMAVAMALVSGMASLWSELHLSGMPGVTDQRGLVTVGLRGDRPRGVMGAAALRDLADRSQTLASVGGESMFSQFNEIEFDGEPLEGQAAAVTRGYFETLAPRLALGRGIGPSEFDGDGAHVLVLSHAFWQERYQGDPAVLGRDIEVADARWKIIGVLDEDFRGMASQGFLFWAPFKPYFRDIQSSMPEEFLDRISFWRVVGRRSPDTGLPAIEAELRQFIESRPEAERAQLPDSNELIVLDGVVEHPQAHRAAQRQVTLLLSAALLIALVAAVNIGIFLLARAPGRRRELALRQSVGATPRRLAGQLLVEAAVLVALAAGLGMALSIWLAAGFRELAFLDNAGFTGQLFNPPALAFSAALAALFTGLVALVPITLTGTSRLAETSRQVSARPGIFQHVSGLIQLSLAGLVGGAALAFLAHLWLMENRDLGFNDESIQVATVAFKQRPTGAFEPPPAEATFSFREDLRRRLEALPGMEALSFASPLPGQRMMATGRFEIEGENIQTRMANIAPGLFELLDIDLLHGRDFESGGEPGVIVSRSFAEQAWGRTDVVDEFIVRDENDEGDDRGRVLGVVEDVQYDHPDKPPEPLMFTTRLGFAGFMNAVVVRGSADPERLKSEIDSALETHLDLMHVESVRPLSEIAAQLTATDRARALATGVFGVVIALMAGFGFFSMQRFLVDAGRRESAIRMALGAGPKAVRRHVIIQGIRLGLPGLIIGVLLAVIATAWLRDDLIAASIAPLAIAGAAGAALVVLMKIATIHPALVAARMRPGHILKEE